MPDEWLRINCLDVGQGTGVLAELYDEDPASNAPAHTILFDLGSEQAKREAGAPSVEYVVRTLNRMEQPTLDAVYLSHSDSDHINLLPDVLSRFDPYERGRNEGADTLRVRYAMYGGAWRRYKKGRGRNVLDTLSRYMRSNDEEDRTPVQPNALSSYRRTSVSPGRSVGFAELRLLVGNAANTRSGRPTGSSFSNRDGFSINTMSLVVVLEALDSQYVMTGDATGATMLMANQRLRYAQEQDHLTNVIMVTAPHHGSLKTALDLGRVRSRDGARQVVRNFVRLLDARSLHVSAGIRKGFNHPSGELLRLFSASLRQNTEPYWRDEPRYGPRHFHTAYFRKKSARLLTRLPHDTEYVETEWPGTPGWRTVQTLLPLFTSLYYSASHLQNGDTAWPPSPGRRATLYKVDNKKYRKPPFGVKWRYDTTADMGENSYSLQRITNRKALQLFAEWEAQKLAAPAPQPLPLPHARTMPTTPPRPTPPAPPAPLYRPADGRPARGAVHRRRPASIAATATAANGLRRLRVIP
jgi:hypothetical protein